MLKVTDLGRDTKRDELVTRRAALMIAAGKPDREVCAKLDLSQGTLDVLRKSPLFGQMIEAYGEEIEERGMQSVVDDLIKDAPENINFIKRVRDGHFYDKKDRMDARLRAAKMLLDKQAPNADARAANERAASVIIDAKLLSQVLRALGNSGVIDITPEAIEQATGETIQKLMQPKTPEQFAETYEPPSED